MVSRETLGGEVGPYVVLAGVLLLFILVFGGLSLLRREPAPVHFAVESLITGAVILGACWVAQAPPTPLLFFAVLYLLMMRARLLVDVANVLARRGRLGASLRLYGLALRVATDRATRGMVLANEGAALLLGGRVAEAIGALEQALSWGLGRKVEAATRCNLGLAYLRQGEAGRGRAQLGQAQELLPGSIYAERARLALQQADGDGS